MALHTGSPATAAVYELGEGVIWDDRAERVRWVDIGKGRVLSGALQNGRIEDVHELSIGQTAGAVALAEDGGLLVAAARGLATVSVEGVLSFGPDLLGDRAGARLNDGSADRFGAFVVGSLSLDGETGDDELLRVYPNGRIETLREGVRLSNGVAFAPDGRTIYHVDTLARTVSRHSYGPGPFDRREQWVTVLDEGDLPAHPDGLTVDAAGMLWVAQYGGGSVRRHSPSGELLDVVHVDAEQATSASFVGADLGTLAITTAQEGLATTTDGSGAIFLACAGVTGLPARCWAGSTVKPYWLRPDTEESSA